MQSTSIARQRLADGESQCTVLRLCALPSLDFSDNGSSRSRVLFDDLLDLTLVCSSIFLEQVICICLGGRFGVGFVEQFLDAEEDLFDGDGRLPAFFFVQDG